MPHRPVPDFLPSLNTTRRATIRGTWKKEIEQRSHQQRKNGEERDRAEEPPAEKERRRKR
jgi:hypothetical protein